jgi:hypothetical protein
MSDPGRLEFAESATLVRILAAKRHTSFGEFARSNQVLLDLLEGWRESVCVQEHAAKILGMIGYNHFHIGDTAVACEFMEMARHACAESGDREGVEVYSENLAIMRARMAGSPG